MSDIDYTEPIGYFKFKTTALDGTKSKTVVICRVKSVDIHQYHLVPKELFTEAERLRSDIVRQTDRYVYYAIRIAFKYESFGLIAHGIDKALLYLHKKD